MKKLIMLVVIMGLSTTMTFAQEAKIAKHAKTAHKTEMKKEVAKAETPKLKATSSVTASKPKK